MKLRPIFCLGFALFFITTFTIKMQIKCIFHVIKGAMLCDGQGRVSYCDFCAFFVLSYAFQFTDHAHMCMHMQMVHGMGLYYLYSLCFRFHFKNTCWKFNLKMVLAVFS